MQRWNRLLKLTAVAFVALRTGNCLPNDFFSNLLADSIDTVVNTIITNIVNGIFPG